jgi:hypothetical protein
MLREGSTVFIELQNVPSILKGDTQSFMIQNSFTSTTHFSVALTYDPERRLTSVFVHGLSQDEIDALIKDVIAQRESIAFPMLLPSLLLNFRMGSASIKVRDCHLQVVEIEHETGFQTNWGANKQCCSVSQRQPAGRNRYDVIDFDRVTGDLTSLSSKLAYCEYVCEVFLPMVERFDIINGRLLQIVSSENKKRLAKMEARLRAENAFLRSCLRGTLCRAQYLSKRSQAQVQTVRAIPLPSLAHY